MQTSCQSNFNFRLGIKKKKKVEEERKTRERNPAVNNNDNDNNDDDNKEKRQTKVIVWAEKGKASVRLYSVECACGETVWFDESETDLTQDSSCWATKNTRQVNAR